MTVRTRVAPSPTGDPHVGTAYIALFNLCFAKQHQGQFILRIEDTDQTRSTKSSETAILDSLRWLGLDWDEGPDVGGPHGPYRQSERSEIYQQHITKLLEKKQAFYCFCSEKRLNDLRNEQQKNKEKPGYDGKCIHLSQGEIEKRLAENRPFVIRLKIPEQGACEFEDMLRGPISIDWSEIDMQVLMKADGLPTYHLANVVDDHLMGITHVIRGEEWINSAPKHYLLYQYFGWKMPKLCHMPLLRNPDKSKLSKRKNPTSIKYYERMGYLPEALLNYLGRMGWSMPDEREKFTLQQMQDHFNLERISLGGPVFDQEKLNWLNSTWIREDLDLLGFKQRIQNWLTSGKPIDSMLPLVKERAQTFSDVIPMLSFLFAGFVEVKKEQFEHKTQDNDQLRQMLQFMIWRFESINSWSKESIFACCKELAETTSIKLKELMPILFMSIAGTAKSLSITDAMAFLGPEITLARLRQSLKILGGVSKKDMKKWESAYRKLTCQQSHSDSKKES